MVVLVSYENMQCRKWLNAILRSLLVFCVEDGGGDECPSENLVTAYKTARCHNPGDHNLNIHLGN